MYVTYVGNPNETTVEEDNSLYSVEIAQFKRVIDHKVFRVILQVLETLSVIGEAVMGGDNQLRLLFPDESTWPLGDSITST